MPYHKLPHRVHHIRRMRTLYASDSVTWYFAYGANLNRAHMRRHCPHGEPVGCAVLYDFRLVFRGVLDLEPWPGEAVPGVVWRIRKSEEAALDRYEGFPLLYRKEEHPVDLEHGEAVTAMLYRMNHGKPAPPRPAYLDRVRQGYRDFSMPLHCLDTALVLARRPLLRRFPHCGRTG